MNSIIAAIEAALGVAWKGLETFGGLALVKLESGAIALFHIATGGFAKFTADEWTLLRAFVAAAIAAGAAQNTADLETAVLNLAQGSGAAFVADIGSPLLQALIGELQSATPA